MLVPGVALACALAIEIGGNGDSQPDAQQANVASLPLSASRQSSTPGAGAGSYITIWSEAVTGDCDQLEDVRVLEATRYPADVDEGAGFDHPLGLVAFELRRCQLADVYFNVAGANFGDVAPAVRLYGSLDPASESELRWFEHPGEVRLVSSDTVRIRLGSSVPGNLRADSANIMFVGSLAQTSQIFASGFELQ